MLSSKLLFLGRFVASTATIVTCVGCATSATIPRPALIAQSPPSPAIDDADRTRHADVQVACTMDGVPRVIASKAAPPAGLDASADSERLLLRFARRAGSRVVVALNPESLEVVEATDSPRSSLADARFGGLHRFEVDGARFEAAFAARVRWETSVGEAAGESSPRDASTPVIVRVDSYRSVLAWTEGSAHTGRDVRVQTIGRGGEALGAPITLSHEGSAIGRPALAVAPSGKGIVAFFDSTEQGFELVAASLNCGPLSTPVTPPSWASLIAQ